MLKEIHLISTPIGNREDITLRAIDTLKKASVIIVEDYRVTKKLLDQLDIEIKNKEWISLKRNNEEREARDIAQSLILQKGIVVLVSDAGSPSLADPGQKLVRELIELGIEVNYHPGASSIIGSLITSGLDVSQFYFAGFLPRIESERIQQLKKLIKIKTLLILLETPYRLTQLLKSVKKVFGPYKKIVLCFDLTTDQQEIYRGNIKEALLQINTSKKRPFVLLIDHTNKTW